MRRLEWTTPAMDDLAAIDGYWWSIDKDHADSLLTAIESAAEFLSGMPEAGPSLEEKRARKWRVWSTPYLLIYRVRPDSIEVLRVYHGKQDWMTEL